MNDEIINNYCMGCYLKYGCLKICNCHPKDVLSPPCGKYAIGLANYKTVFWTVDKDEWLKDPNNKKPTSLKFVDLSD